MANPGTSGTGRPRTTAAKLSGPTLSPEHYLRIIFHRKWIVLGVFLAVSAGTFVYSYRLPNVFSSETLILVDPQKVPESYVKATVTGDVRNRLNTLSQQILSATRLQKIIDSMNLYPEEKKTMAREDLISLMRGKISVALIGDPGGNQDLQAFRISFTGKEPRQVAQVANELASLFIDENLKAREQQATGTNEFLQNQMQETRRTLETQEAKLKDFKLKHIGEMPEQQTADLQILGQLQSQLQLESDALSRAEQQKNLTQTMMTQPAAAVVDLDGNDQPRPKSNTAAAETKGPAGKPLSAAKTQLAALLARGYTEKHPSIRKLRAQISDEEEAAKEAGSAPETVVATVPAAPEPATVAAAPPAPRLPPAFSSNNPVLQSQLKQLEVEIAKRRQEQQRLSKQIASYHAKLEAIPVREQQIVELVRDYEMSKAHYGQLLDKQLSAATATQLEIRQKGEKFSILDPAQPAERPSSPKRAIINAGGALAGLGLGLLLALITEFMGMSITSPDQIAETGIPVLEVIPVIQTFADRTVQRRRTILATAFTVALTVLASGIFVFYRYRG